MSRAAHASDAGPAGPRPPADTHLAPGRFYGRVERQWTSDLVTVSLVRHHAARAVPEHSHAHAFMMLLLEGHYREHVRDQRVECLPMSLVFHPEGMVHQDDIVSDGARFLTVEMSPAMLSGEMREDGGVSSIRDLSGGPSVWSMLRLLRDLPVASHSPLAIEERVADLLRTLRIRPSSSRQHAEPAWLARIDRLIDARYREPIALHELAAEAGVHPVHLSRVFKRARGLSIRTAVHRRRVMNACRLLRESRKPLAEIALLTGFYDQSHLCGVLRRVTGFSPRGMRQLMEHQRPSPGHDARHDTHPRP